MEQNQFVKGLITEASPLSFPENASLAEENFVLNTDGTRQRRLGMDYEAGHALRNIPFTLNTQQDLETFTWKNASNSKGFDISVVKIGERFYFFDGRATAVSSQPLNQGVYLVIPEPETPAGKISLPTKYDFAFINGYMVVTTGSSNVHILSFNLTDELAGKVSIEMDTKRLKIRDLFGIDEPNVPDDFRPTVLLADHEYNLRNQGWLPNLQCAWKGVPSVSLVDSIHWTFSDGLEPVEPHANLYPSNADMVWANKAGPGTVDPLALNSYDPAELLKATYGDMEAPKGHYIIDLFERGESRFEEAEDDGTVVSETSRTEATIGGITAVSDFMGRAVYAINEFEIVDGDDNSPSVGSMLLFSQARDEKGALTRCHSVLDPTGGDEFSPLSTDGGFVIVSGLGHVNGIQAHGNSLFVFSDKGVWQINGGDRLFTMTNVNQNQITNVGSLNKRSVVVTEQGLMYFSDGGIYVISGIGQEGKQATAENITQKTIQSLYDDIPVGNKTQAVSYYDRFTRQVKWLYADKIMPNPNYYNTELILDLNLGAFSVSTIKATDSPSATPYVIGFLERPDLIQSASEDTVTVENVVVTVLGNPVVVSTRVIDNEVETSNKYWTVQQEIDRNNLTVSEYKDLLFRDWFIHDEVGVDAEAFLLTGSATAGSSAVFKRLPYITTHMRRTGNEFIEDGDDFASDNPSSCTLQVQWEWTDSPETGLWSNPQEIYKYPRTFIPDEAGAIVGHTVITTKSRIRGKGRAFSLLFKTKPLHDCHLYGWSLELDAEVSV